MATKKKPSEASEIASENLNPRQQAFVNEYCVNGWNAKKAAIKAGYSAKTARSIGCQLLTNIYIKAQINAVLRSQHLNAEEVLQRLREMATINATDFINADGTLNKKILKEKGYLVRGIKPATNTRGVEIELHDAKDALALIGKHLALFTDNVDLKSDGQPVKLVSVNVDMKKITG